MDPVVTRFRVGVGRCRGCRRRVRIDADAAAELVAMQAMNQLSAAPAVAEVQEGAWFPTNASTRDWARMSSDAPQLVSTMRRYLLQLTTFLAPRSVEVADTTLRQLAGWLTTATDVAVVNQIARGHVED